MGFSVWITVISILLAVLLAVFKFDEWEIIRLKHVEKYLLVPILFLLAGGISAYFESNLHPHWLNVLWVNYGLPSGLWAMIWMICFSYSIYHYWNKFTNAKPSIELIKKYVDYLDIYEPAKFSVLFRKYERYFFNSKDVDAWHPYAFILSSSKWWVIAPTHFKEMVFNNPDRFYKMREDVLKSLLRAQLSSLPESQLGKELETQWNGVNLSEHTPILNIFLSDPKYIETGYNKGIFMLLVKEAAEEYFSSPRFHGRDTLTFSLKPSGYASQQVAPNSLLPFYFIQLVDCFWIQVIITQTQEISGSFFYLTWTEKLCLSPFLGQKS